MSQATIPVVPTTKVLAIGLVTADATPEALAALIQREVRDTVRLHLDGKIDQWFGQTERNGVVFFINATSREEAQRLLDVLPLAKAGLMRFELVALGPLAPLQLLLG